MAVWPISREIRALPVIWVGRPGTLSILRTTRALGTLRVWQGRTCKAQSEFRMHYKKGNMRDQVWGQESLNIERVHTDWEGSRRACRNSCHGQNLNLIYYCTVMCSLTHKCALKFQIYQSYTWNIMSLIININLNNLCVCHFGIFFINTLWTLRGKVTHLSSLYYFCLDVLNITFYCSMHLLNCIF